MFYPLPMISLTANSGLVMPMTDTHCILLLGLTDSAFALSHFHHAGHQVTAAPWQGRATEGLDNPDLDMVYLQPSDDERAIDELKQILGRRPDVAVVLVCARPSLDLAIQSWRNGAADILFMPLTRESLDDNLRRMGSNVPDRLLARRRGDSRQIPISR